jgi:hypothetical protein
MRRLLIGITLALLVLCFLKGSPKSEQNLAVEVIAELNQTLDERMAENLASMRLGAELSAAMADDS